VVSEQEAIGVVPNECERMSIVRAELAPRFDRRSARSREDKYGSGYDHGGESKAEQQPPPVKANAGLATPRRPWWLRTPWFDRHICESCYDMPVVFDPTGLQPGVVA